MSWVGEVGAAAKCSNVGYRSHSKMVGEFSLDGTQAGEKPEALSQSRARKLPIILNKRLCDFQGGAFIACGLQVLARHGAQERGLGQRKVLKWWLVGRLRRLRTCERIENRAKGISQKNPEIARGESRRSHVQYVTELSTVH